VPLSADHSHRLIITLFLRVRFPKAMLVRPSRVRGAIMTKAFAQCPSCGKRNRPDGRYCIVCGSILHRVYCSSCGTANPEDLEGCLECGTPIPKLTELRWNPIVTIITPTSAMIERNPQSGEQLTHQSETPQTSNPGLLMRLRWRLSRKSQPPEEVI